MWLPKDERRMLKVYYRYLPNSREQKYFVQLSERAYAATQNLIERGFLREITEHGSHAEHVEHLASHFVGEKVSMANLLSCSQEGYADREIVLGFTLAGHDLAGKYTRPLLSTGLWWAEYKHHWIWVIVSYIFGILSGVLVTLLTARNVSSNTTPMEKPTDTIQQTTS